MIGHTGLQVSDFAKSKTFYAAALAPLGYQAIMELPASVTGAAPYLAWRRVVVAMVRRAAAEGDIQGGIDVDAAGHAIWSSLVGTALLSGATGEDPIPRLAQVWAVTLRGVVPAESLGYFTEFVNRITQQYQRPQPISTA